MILLLVALVLANVSVAQGASDAGTPWQVVVVGPGSIAVPRGWRNLDGLRRQTLVFRHGDGIGLPALDDTGQPLQAGLVVEELPPTKVSLREVALGVATGASKDSRLQALGETNVEALKLADGSDSVVLTSVFLKEGHRRSLQMKVVARSPDARTWMVSGFLVGGKESRWCMPGSAWASWLQVHVTSLTFKPRTLDEKRLRDAYRQKPAKLP